MKATSFAELSGVLSGNVEVSKLAGGSYEDTMNAASNAPVKKQKKASSGCTMKFINTQRKEISGLSCTDAFSMYFLSQHPGGELAILTLTGKNATAEFDMIHPPDVVKKYAADAVIGALGDGGEDEDDEYDDSSHRGRGCEAQQER